MSPINFVWIDNKQRYVCVICIPSSLDTSEQAASQPTVNSNDNENELGEDSEDGDDDDDDKEEPEYDNDPNWTPERIDEAYQKLGEDTVNKGQSTTPK